MSDTMFYTGSLTITTCWCGIKHGVPADLYSWAKQSRSNGVYCPIGHRWVVGRSIEQENRSLRERLDSERANAQFWRGQNQASERRRAAAKGQQTKLKKRIANGICPCCTRTFQNVAAHMKRQHPEYVKGDSE